MNHVRKRAAVGWIALLLIVASHQCQVNRTGNVGERIR
jgi:hypothetical protein